MSEMADASGRWRVAPFGGKFPESEHSIKESENPTRKAECHISKFRTRLTGCREREAFLRVGEVVLDPIAMIST